MMKNQKVKMVFHFFVSVCINFGLIYIFVFFGGWKLLESGNPILLEIVAAIAMGFIFWVMYEITKGYEVKLAELERRIESLEGKKGKKQ